MRMKLRVQWMGLMMAWLRSEKEKSLNFEAQRGSEEEAEGIGVDYFCVA